MALKLIDESKAGETKGAAKEEAVLKHFQGEALEVGLYLAMAQQAQWEGFPEVAAVLKSIAWDDARNAVHYALLNGMVSRCTKQNLERMLAGELVGTRGKGEAAARSADAAGEETHEVFDEIRRREARHAKALAGLLRRYFGE